MLGAFAVVLSLLCLTVQCVCYSEHLSERDNDLFKDVFSSYGVTSRIKYSKMTTMTEDSIAKKCNIREFTTSMINGKFARKFQHKLPLLPTKNDSISIASRTRNRIISKTDPHMLDAEENIMTTPSNMRIKQDGSSSSNGKEVPADIIPTSSRKVVSQTSCQRDLPLPLNDEEVLLVDEVDVFFGPDFYGKTYNQVAEIQDPLTDKLLKKSGIYAPQNLLSQN